MNSNHFRALTLKTLVAICLVAFFIADSQAQTGAARINDEDGSSVDIVVQDALDSELQPPLAALEGKEQIQIAAWTFWRGRIGVKRVVISRTEVGPINAVAATTLAIVNFKPKLIINQGTAGANDPELKIFDIVVGEARVDYGAFRSSHADEGIDMSRWTSLHHRLRIDGKERKAYPRFAGYEEARRIAMETSYKRGGVIKGAIGFAFEFNKEIDRLVWGERRSARLRKTWRALVRPAT